MVECEGCGGDEFEETDQGTLECVACGLLSQAFLKETDDLDMAGIQLRVRTKKAPTPKEESTPKSKANKTSARCTDDQFLRGLTMLVATQAATLVNQLGMDPGLEHVMREITSALLHPKHLCDPLPRTIMKPATSLAICAWGLMYIKADKSPRDVYDLAMTGRIPYLIADTTVAAQIVATTDNSDGSEETNLAACLTPRRFSSASHVYDIMRDMVDMPRRLWNGLDEVASMVGHAKRVWYDKSAPVPASEIDSCLIRWIDEFKISPEYLSSARAFRRARKIALAAHYDKSLHFWNFRLSIGARNTRRMNAPGEQALCTELDLAADVINAIRISLMNLPADERSRHCAAILSPLKSQPRFAPIERRIALRLGDLQSICGRDLDSYVEMVSTSRLVLNSSSLPSVYKRPTSPENPPPAVALIDPCPLLDPLKYIVEILISKTFRVLDVSGDVDRHTFVGILESGQCAISEYIAYKQRAKPYKR